MTILHQYYQLFIDFMGIKRREGVAPRLRFKATTWIWVLIRWTLPELLYLPRGRCSLSFLFVPYARIHGI